jgi:PAS domain S-box-containing protein
VRSRIAVVAVVAVIVALIIGAGIFEFSSDWMRPYANTVQWVLLAGLLIAAGEVVRRLNKSESKLRALLASLDEVILIVDREGRYLEIPDTNPALLYRPMKEIIGRRIHEIFPAEIADGFVAEIRRALASEKPTSVDYTLNIDGKDVWFNATVTRLSESNVMWVARDITQRKMAEIELEKGV